jgi:hypothetical protein
MAKAEPKAAATVAAPVRGCPAPDFEAAELRANRVLEVFLTPEQIEDFRTTNSFLTLGADTGHRYLISSRHSPRALRRGLGRSLFDVEEQRAYCVHDWEVPAAEEMLALHLFVMLPGRERYVRHIPDLGQD